MTQGNPFGRTGGTWMPAAKLRQLYHDGWKYDEIAEANQRWGGWKPSRAAVSRKMVAIGLPPRNKDHTDLIPWRTNPEHNGALIRHQLQAESRRRQGVTLSETDKKLLRSLKKDLAGRGTPMVVIYHPEVGFAFARREDGDTDIIRPPKRDALLRKTTRAQQRARSEGMTRDDD